MPKYTDIKKVLVLGSGPIVIGQAAEFDYAGTQACRALKEEGLEVVLINSNPATIMTDKDICRPCLYRAHEPALHHPGHRKGAPRRPPAQHGRPDRPKSGYGAV